MTKQEKENNLSIAEMMGFYIRKSGEVEIPNKYGFYCEGFGYSQNPRLPKKKVFRIDGPEMLRPSVNWTRNLQFHSDWNWLMEAVSFVQKRVIKNGDEFAIELYEGLPNKPTTYVSYEKNKEYKNKNPKKAVFQAISQFATDFNKKQTK